MHSTSHVYIWLYKTIQRQKTLGHLRSINSNMIIHFANQSQTCQLLKILTNFFFQTFHEKKLWSGAISPRLNWYRKSTWIIKSVIYIYIYIYMLSSWYNILTISPIVPIWSEFTGWAIIEELSIRRRLSTFLISCGQKTHVKHCYVDLSSWHELWFAITCMDMDVIFDLSPAILQLWRWFRRVVSIDCLGRHEESFLLKYNDMK